MSFRTAYGYSRSENGWRMCNRDECSLPISPGMTFINTAPIRNGAPLAILSAWLKYYDTKIAPIVSPVWGWSATNDVATSNHLSGTALDINAPQWPWGERRMPADLKARIRRGLGLFEGTVFWGADWSRADEMHFQMNYPEGDGRNEAFAARLRDGYLGLLAPERGGTDEGDEMTPEDRDMLTRVHRELTQKYPSRSKYRKDEKPVDTLAGYVLNLDGRIHEDHVEREALRGLKWAIDLVRREAGKGDESAKAVLAQIETEEQA